MGSLGAGAVSVRAIVALSCLSAVCLALLAANVYYGGNRDYTFLAWNLFLAAIPFGLALIVERAARLGARWAILPVGALCVLFLPNAPYMVTDFVHVGADPGVPGWSDFVLFTAFAATGLLFGWLSLRTLVAVARKNVGTAPARIAAIAVIAASSFGIFLGRFETVNSWDLVVRPSSVVRVVLDGPIGKQAAFTICFSLFLTAVFAFFEWLAALARGARPGLL